MLGIQNPILRQYAVVIIVNLSTVSFGMGIAWVSPVLVKLRSANTTVLPEPISEEEGSWMVSIGGLTSLLAFSVVFLVDHIGRKYTLILANIPKVLMCIAYTFADRFWIILLGRSIAAIADAVTLIVIPMYASEIASTEVRGRLGTILQIFASIGILIMLSIGPLMTYVSLNIVMTCVSIAATVPLFLLPKSPYFLYTKGRKEEALDVLIYLRGSEELAKEDLKGYAANEDSEVVDKRELMKEVPFMKATGIVFVLAVGGCFIGFNAVSFYLQTVLDSTQTSVRSEIASMIIGCIQLTASVCTAFISDRFGRKPILIVSLVGMSFGMIGLGVFFKLRDLHEEVTGIMNFVPLASIILVVYFYSAGPGTVFWVLIAELFDGPTRSIGSTFFIFISTASNFILTKFFPSMTTSVGPAVTYWMFGVNSILLSIFILFCVPETRGKSIHEIQVTLGASDVDTDEYMHRRSTRKV